MFKIAGGILLAIAIIALIPVMLVLCIYLLLPAGIVLIICGIIGHGGISIISILVGGFVAIIGTYLIHGMSQCEKSTYQTKASNRHKQHEESLPPTERWPYTASPYYKKR